MQKKRNKMIRPTAQQQSIFQEVKWISLNTVETEFQTKMKEQKYLWQQQKETTGFLVMKAQNHILKSKVFFKAPKNKRDCPPPQNNPTQDLW